MKMKMLLASAAAAAMVGLAAPAAQAAVYFNFSWFDGIGNSATGQIETDGGTQILAITGVQTQGAAHSAISGLSPWAGSDNQFFNPAIGGSYFSFGGASYSTVALHEWNLFSWNGTNNALSYMIDTVGYPQNGQPITFRIGTGGATSETAGAIPEPASWSLMILGFGGAGAVLRSQRRRVLAVA